MAKDNNISATTTLSNWNFYDQHVQNDMPGGKFINAASTLIAAGPPRLSQAGQSKSGSGDLAFPIGVVENFGLNQSKQVQKLFEIGSKRAYHIPGRTVGQVSIGRVMYWGPSLMRVMYAYYPSEKTRGGNVLSNDSATNSEVDLGDSTPQINQSPGFGGSNEIAATAGAENNDFFINLASDLFDHPLGLMVYMRDSENMPYGAFYLEDAYIQTHNFSVNASSVIIAEGVSLQYDKLVPISIGSVAPNAASTIE